MFFYWKLPKEDNAYGDWSHGGCKEYGSVVLSNQLTSYTNIKQMNIFSMFDWLVMFRNFLAFFFNLPLPAIYFESLKSSCSCWAKNQFERNQNGVKICFLIYSLLDYHKRAFCIFNALTRGCLPPRLQEIRFLSV